MEITLKSNECTQHVLSQRQTGQSRIIHLGGMCSPKKKMSQTLPNQSWLAKSIPTSFNWSNPFFHVHKALYSEDHKQSVQPKNFQNVLDEVHEMKQMCEKLFEKDLQVDVQIQKTLIMDLQNLQTRRVNFDRNDDESSLRSQESIKDHFQENSQQISPCYHNKCDDINQVLQRALRRLQQLSSKSQNHQQELQTQKQMKLKAQQQNQSLRAQISQLDRIKCEQIENLKNSIQKVKNKSMHRLMPLIQTGRVPLEDIESGGNIPRQPFKMCKKSDPQDQNDCFYEHSGKLQNIVYL